MASVFSIGDDDEGQYILLGILYDKVFTYTFDILELLSIGSFIGSFTLQ